MCQVNGESLLGARHKHAVSVINSLRDHAVLLICDSYNSDTSVLPAKVIQLQHQIHELAVSKVDQTGGLLIQGREMSLDNGGQGQGTAFQGHKRLDEGHGLVVQDHDVEPHRVGQGRGSVRGRKLSSDSGSQEGQDTVFRGHKAVAEKVAEGHSPVAQGHEVSLDNGSQGQRTVFQGHRLVAEKVAEDDGAVDQGHNMSLDTCSEGQELAFEGHENVTSGVMEPRTDEMHHDRARQRRLARY